MTGMWYCRQGLEDVVDLVVGETLAAAPDTSAPGPLDALKDPVMNLSMTLVMTHNVVKGG